MIKQMKKHSAFAILILVAIAFSAVSCSKEEAKKYDEEQLVGSWKIPLIVEYPDMSGKTLTILPGHTALLNNISFNYWKLEGDMLTLTRDINHGYNNHEMGMMKVQIIDLSDSTMLFVGNFIHAVNSTIDKQGDMSGLYVRTIPATVPTTK